MARFEVDRSSLPGSWDEPLIFRLTRGEQTVVAEVERGAVVEFAWAPQNVGGLASRAALDQIDIFLLDLEDAVERLYEQDPKDRLSLDWNDLHP